jgi:15-cis-phytoene synthase
MSFETCREITRQNSKSFYFASFPLPVDKRMATYATYAFCRTADDIVDAALPGSEGDAKRELDELRLLLDRIEAGETPSHPLWEPLARTIHRYEIPLHAFRTLLDGVESDLIPRRFQTFEELRSYCYQVASTVGIALSHIFGYAEENALSYAANMGIAMQLTNIIRDVGTDWRLDRVYLPLEEIERFGYDESRLSRGFVDDHARALFAFQIARAREYYRRAFQGIRYLTRDGSHWTAYLMGDVYRGILDEVERSRCDRAGSFPR